ncbi:MAG: DUF1361 domain-containing protein [Anaerolineales bacterium]|nr:DUF1361 domain-containing protein [Anaerolineales bacterium]
MIQTILLKLQPIKFRLAIFLLLSCSSLLSITLFRVRTILSGNGYYHFLIWNLFLAWLPFWMALMASSFSKKRKYLFVTLPLTTIPWLLFFPNSLYILTDLFHLSNPRPFVPIWFDVLLINWFAWTGIFLGVFSLYLMHDIVHREFGRMAGWFFVLTIGILSGIGIYVGRFLRWNSWDVIFNPLERLNELLYYATHPSPQAILFISVFSSFFIFIYITLYTFGLLFQEQIRPASQEIK